MSQSNAIELVDITKTFGSVVANDKVCLSVKKGEILSLLGENGSGKTTLMNMLSGIYFPDSGQIFIDGNEVSIRSPRDAFDLGIGMIHQHFKLVDVFDAVENILLGTDSKKTGNKKQATADIKALMDKYGFELDLKKRIYEMSVSEKQTVEIIKVLYRGAGILILDEPTAVLTPQETDRLFEVLKNMRRDGKAIIIITHKLHEVLSISDRVSVLRKGSYIGTVDTKDATEASLTQMMVGEKIDLDIKRPKGPEPKDKIKVTNLCCKSSDGVDLLKDISFSVRSGEILGIAGVAGSGQKELLESIAGLCPIDSGSIEYFDDNETVSLVGMNPRKIRALGVSLSFVPEDRLGMGLVGSMDMTENMMLRNYQEGSSVFVERKKPRQLAQEIINKLKVVTPGVSTPVRRLSGGNVQKVLVGREISNNPRVLMTAYAVRGLDINTSITIYDLLNEQKMKGVAVIYVGEDLDVLLALCDRIMIMFDGKITGIVDPRETTKEEIGLKMTKHTKEEDK